MPGHLNFYYFGPPEGVIPADLSGEDLEQAIAAYLIADPVVSSIAGDRVYPIVPPQSSTLPDLFFNTISGTTQYDLHGYIGISTARVRFTARSTRISDCASLRHALRQLSGFRGMFGAVRIEWIEFEDVKDDYDPPLPGSDEGTYKRQWDLLIKYRESIPAN